MDSKPTLISALTPSTPNFTIHARVLTKSPVKDWSNSKGNGSFFSVILEDAFKTTIRATFFQKAVDKFHGKLEVDKSYSFSKGRVKLANKKFNTCKSHLELIMDVNSKIVRLEESCEIRRVSEENAPPRAFATARTSPPRAALLSATTTPPRSRRTLTPVKPNSPGRLFQDRSIDSGVIKQGDWNKPEIGVFPASTKKATKKKASLPVTPTPGDDSNATSKPLYDTNLTDADRAKLRADRAAAAEARIQQQEGRMKKNKTRKRKSNAPPLVSPHSQRRMRWNLG